MTLRNHFLVALSFVSIVISPAAASAAAITVNNPSFEILPGGGLPIPYPGNGHFSEAAIPGWTNFQSPGVSGQYRPGNIPGAEYSFLPDGITFAYSNGGTISQTVGATVQVGDVYTLFVSIGNRADLPGAQGTADLLVNGNRYFATGSFAAAGGWTGWTAVYTGLEADAGASIKIELNASGPQGNFDGVSLNDSGSGDGGGETTPEPVSLFLMGSGCASILLFVRRRANIQR